MYYVLNIKNENDKQTLIEFKGYTYHAAKWMMTPSYCGGTTLIVSLIEHY